MKKALNELIRLICSTSTMWLCQELPNYQTTLTELAINVMSWIFYAARPLQMSELQQAIAIENAMTDLTLDDVTPADIILESCASLVRHDKYVGGVVRFSHEASVPRESAVLEQLRTQLVMARIV